MEINYASRHAYNRVSVSDNLETDSFLQEESQHQDFKINHDGTKHSAPGRTTMAVFDVMEAPTTIPDNRWKAWQKGVLASACMASFAFLVNTSALVLIVKASASDEGYKQVYRGSCSTVKSLELWIHLGVNIVSTVLLGASNYCMQCIVAPTRREVDQAHIEGEWLSIGAPSIRNLQRLSKRKITLWCLLALSSIPLHLFYNTAFFAAYQANQHQFFIAEESFTIGASYNMTPLTQTFYASDSTVVNFIDLSPAQKLQGSWTRLTNQECIDAYTHSLYITSHRNLVYVTKSSSATDEQDLGSDVAACESCGCIRLAGYTTASYFDLMSLGGWQCTSDCSASDWVVYGYSIDHCIAETAEEQCLFSGSLVAISLVTVCNLIKAVTMITTLLHVRGEPFLALGDAVASFTSNPDATTTAMCLLSQDDVTRRKMWPRNPTLLGSSSPGTAARLPGKLRFLSVDRSSLCLTWLIFLLCLSAAIGGYTYVVKELVFDTSNKGSLLSKTSLAVYGFGSPTPSNSILPYGLWDVQTAQYQVLATALIANSGQVALSIMYLFLNRYLTLIYLAVEWRSYATQRKGLRVSKPTPRTEQRSTYFLQLPYRISLPLMALSTTAHWLTSAGIFLAVVRVFDPSGNLIEGQAAYANGYVAAASTRQYAALGFSPAALALTMGTFLLMLVCLLWISLKKIRSGMPIVGYCSAAISAACHTDPNDRGAETKALMWGCVDVDQHEVPEEDSPGHCCFSSGPVKPVEPGTAYS